VDGKEEHNTNDDVEEANLHDNTNDDVEGRNGQVSTLSRLSTSNVSPS
jgi:hypothetical protein